MLLGLVILARAAALPAQAPSTPEILAASVLPLPTALRDGAGVRLVSPAGVSILRPSSNGLMCTADRPGDAVFDVRCYQVEFLAVMDYVRAGRQQGMPDSTLDARLREAERQGVIRFPASPTAGYRMLGPIAGFDSAAVTTTTAIDRWQSVHFPFRTAAELGLPTEREGTMPFVMSSGTWWSHVMIVHNAAALP
ncbi:MAG: hypothetical protein JNM53_10445 [Gemmatimonadetes bacterium]|nr:hypothetical protein [Gemmatimonadota bacterium]